MPTYDRLIYASNVYTANQQQLHLTNAAIVIDKGIIIWLGEASDMPDEYQDCHDIVRADSGCITPGLIDCHTHLVYAGDRSGEFKQRLEGVSYADIAKQGGGIQATVKATRDCSEEKLLQLAQQRLNYWLQNGVTDIEIKSGYGLNFETERKILKVIKQLATDNDIGIKSTLLAAHSLAPEYLNTNTYASLDEAKSAYIKDICDNMLPQFINEGLIDAIDAFCEDIAFSTEQLQPLFEQAKSAGLPVKLHAEQLSNQGAAAFAAQYSALSVDHLEYLDEAAIKIIAENGTVAVLLPGAFYYLNETQLPPIQLLRNYGVPMAIATDCNPGSSPCNSLPLMINMACVEFALTPAEALAGVTINAAKALGIADQTGSLEVGKVANMVLWDVSEVEQLAYLFGHHKAHWTLYEGQFRATSPTVVV